MKNSNKQNYFQALDKSINSYNAKLTLEQEKQVVKAFIDSGEELIRKIARSKDGSVNNKIYKQYAYDLYVALNSIISGNVGKVTLNSLETQVMGTLKLLAGNPYKIAEVEGNLKRSAVHFSSEAAKRIFAGDIYKDNMGLSARIWKISNEAGDTIQNTVARGLTTGRSAKQLAEDLEGFVNPKARKYWDKDKVLEILGPRYAKKDLEYNALRLARTTISHSATSATKQWGKVNPYAQYVRWHSAHAAGRTCAICLDLDEQVFKIDECPFDHPNGLCHQTIEFKQSMDEMADELADWINGAENEMLDKWYSELNFE